MVFTNKTYGSVSQADRFSRAIKKRPILYFGLPFVFTIVAGSFVLSELTTAKYDVQDNRIKAMSKEDGLKLSKNRRKLNIQEEYWRLQAQDVDDDDWEIKRVDSQAAPGVTTSPKYSEEKASES